MLMALDIRTCDGISRDIRYKKMKNMMKLIMASLKNRNMGGDFIGEWEVGSGEWEVGSGKWEY
jgi:hypothetical protein